MASDKVRYEVRDNVAVVTLDDGKANALSHEVIDAVRAALDRAEREARAVLLTGREKRLSGGFDLGVMTSGPEAARNLVTAGAELMLRLYTFPRPVVVACSGHALAAGAILLLVADARIGAEGEFKIGLNEVAIQLTLPIFAMELARDRLSKRHFSAAVTQARIFDPVTAKDAGYLDVTVQPAALLDTALDSARRLAALPDPAFRDTKQRERAATVKLIRDTLADDMRHLTGVPPA
ncbi:MAG TPA: crotonase/enoyl-CoA hydratase family protein [Candidatus Margulisiibacteriota bacterium]|nr:crotonase/enoyl-CoA hydratase family protein [Candidatus Margulisiibacteriota bacterium]